MHQFPDGSGGNKWGKGPVREESGREGQWPPSSNQPCPSGGGNKGDARGRGVDSKVIMKETREIFLNVC